MQEDITTPMMKQYLAIKQQYMDCLVLYRMGDFYELFQDDAVTGARILNITLTGKANGKGTRIPMAGVPYHAVDSYLAKLVKAGYKVAICEQLSPPNKKGLVERDVVRIVTPGTLIDEKVLEQKVNNYIISLEMQKDGAVLAIADVSTGYFAVTDVITENIPQALRDELVRINPVECILSEDLYNNPEILGILKVERNINIFHFPQWDEYAHRSRAVLLDHFGVLSLECFGLENDKIGQSASAVLLGYLQQTQKGPVKHIKKIQRITTQDHLMLDRSTIINLELFSTIRDHESSGTLLSVIDRTVTPMGGRRMKQWLRKPLTDMEAISKRHTAVGEIIQKQELSAQLGAQLENVCDLERLVSRLSVGLGNARDIVHLKNTLKVLLDIRQTLRSYTNPLFGELAQQIRTHASGATIGLLELIAYIEKYIVPEPPISIREGGMIQPGIHTQLDSLRKIVGGSRDWILDLETRERERTGIGSLKIRYNHVFGFYIEVSKSQIANVPADYMRKQTLVNAERFITGELKEQEEIILTAEETIHDIEYTLFQEVLGYVLDQIPLLQDSAESISQLDCLASFAIVSRERNYTRPVMTQSSDISIVNGRHPVVETLLKDTMQFVPNSTELNSDNQLLVITGPNMAGKSVYIRQTALIVLLAQMGCFIPAEEGQIGIVDQIFVRSGASDVITSGLSTFMVEMVETAHILNHATEKSLIIMDEIGRGTSTFDGISIAWAVAEYIVTTMAKTPKTLFATHYHELQMLEEKYPQSIKNYHMSVADQQGEPIFLHTLQYGGASHSYGVAVAKLAGLPDEVIFRARILLDDLEKRNASDIHTKKESSLALHDNPDLSVDDSMANTLLIKEMTHIEISQMTPLEALNKLADLKEKLRLFTTESKQFVDGD